MVQTVCPVPRVGGLTDLKLSLSRISEETRPMIQGLTVVWIFAGEDEYKMSRTKGCQRIGCASAFREPRSEVHCSAFSASVFSRRTSHTDERGR